MAQSVFSRRFADRLRVLLAERGFPARRIDCVRAFAHEVGVDVALAEHILSGNAMPSWEHLATICSAFNVEPGYFLDSTASAPEPKLLKAKGAMGGETIVWNPPSGIGGKDTVSPSQELRWITGSHLPNSNIRPTDVVIFSNECSTPIRANHAYMLDENGDFNAMLCAQVHQRAVVFKVFRNNAESPLLLPLKEDGTLNDTELSNLGFCGVGPILGTIRSAANFLPLPT